MRPHTDVNIAEKLKIAIESLRFDYVYSGMTPSMMMATSLP